MLSDKIVKNTIYNSIGKIWGILVAVFLTPYVINKIGVERFGVWALMGAVTSYFSLLDFGTGASFIKYIAEFYTKNEIHKISQIVSTSFIFYSSLTILVVSLASFFIQPLVAFFNIPLYLHNEAAFVLLVGIFIYFGSNAISPFSAIASGLQRMDIQNNAYIAVSIINILGTIFFLQKGYGLPGLMINNIIIFIIGSLINVVIAYRLLPAMKFSLRLFSGVTFRKLFSFGFKVQTARIAGIMVSQADKILIAYFLSSGLVAFYQLGNSVIYYAFSIAVLLVSALMPAFCEIEAKGQIKKLIEAYLAAVRYQAFFTAPFFIFLTVCAFNLIFVWMGPGYEKSALVIQILSVGYALNAIAQVSFAVCMAVNQLRLLVLSSIIIIVLNLVLGVLFIKLFGFAGVLLGSMLALNIGTVYFIIKLNKILNIPQVKFIKVTAPYFLVAIISAGAILLGEHFISYFYQLSSRPLVLVILFIRGILFAGIYITGTYFSKLINVDDFDFLRKKLTYHKRA